MEGLLKAWQGLLDFFFVILDLPNIAKAGGTTTGHSDLGLNSEQQHFIKYYLLWIYYGQILNVFVLDKVQTRLYFVKYQINTAIGVQKNLGNTIKDAVLLLF